jgi:adenylate kinase family enzyme
MDQTHRCGTRIVVVGTSGSGKTTLARTLAARLGLRHVELDALFWGPNWTKSPEDQMRARVTQALSGERWVIDGNYSTARDLISPRADTLIWLDYPLPLILARLARCTLRRLVMHETMWAGNRERMRRTLSRDSIMLWALQSHPRHKRLYPALLADPQYVHLTAIRLHTPRSMKRWLEGISG